MRKPVATALAATLVVGVALVTAGAAETSRCDANLVVYSRNSANPVSLNWNGAACLPSFFAPEAALIADTEDFRIISPGSDSITIGYLEDVRFKPAFVHARLNGLGFSKHRVLLMRTDMSLDQSGAYGYELEVPIDPGESGCLTVTAWYKHKKKTKKGNIKTIEVFRERTRYHTLEAAC